MLKVIRWHLDNAYANYNYLVINTETKIAIAIDPFDAEVVAQKLEQYQVGLKAIFITHEHGDHYYGLSDLLKGHDVPVYAHSSTEGKISGITDFIDDEDHINIQGEMQFKCIYTPGHIKGHVSFYLAAVEALFCGDTIFNAGVGNARHHSADVSDLFYSIQKLKSLPVTTKIYSGHDYFITNLEFSKEICDAKKYNQIIDTLSHETSETRTVSTIGDELRHNLFFNTDSLTLRRALIQKLGHELSDELEVFKALRSMRDDW
jgi:hydroxyacylglutathione hydrolase